MTKQLQGHYDIPADALKLDIETGKSGIKQSAEWIEEGTPHQTS